MAGNPYYRTPLNNRPRLKLPALRKPEVERPECLAFWDGLGEPTFTYFIQDDAGPVKIGQAKNPLERMGLLQCGNPRELYLRMVLPFDVEHGMHVRFREWKVRGEWFGRDEGEQQAILAYAKLRAAEAREDYDGGSEGPGYRYWAEKYEAWLHNIGAYAEVGWSEQALDLWQEGQGAATIARKLGRSEVEVANLLTEQLKRAA